MVSALDRKLLRDLLALKGQVLTIALVVACGVASYITTRGTYASIETAQTTYYERYRFADLFASAERVPEAEARRIESIPGVAEVYPRIVQSVSLPLPAPTELASARLISLPASGPAPLCGIYLRRGRLPEPGQPDEVLVHESFAKAHALGPGDRLPAILNGKRRSLRVVGVALSPEYVFALSGGDAFPDDKRFAVLWMDRAQLGPAFRMEGAFNDLVVRLQPGASPRAVVAALDRQLEPYGGRGAYAREQQLSHRFVTGELTQLRTFATVTPVIFLGVAAFLLNLVLARLVSLQRTQIATLKAIGYGGRQVGLHYLKLVVLVVAGGTLLGIGLGAYLGQGMTDLYQRYFRFPNLSFALDGGLVATAALAAFAAALLGGLGTARRVMRLPPAEAMQPPAPASYRTSWLERAGLFSWLGPAGKMILRELTRRPLRTALSALGIALAIGILVVGRFMYDAVEDFMDLQFSLAQRDDLTVTFLRPQPRRSLGELAQLPGVQRVEGLRAVPVRFHVGHRHRESVLLGYGPEVTLRQVVEFPARVVPLPNEGVVLTRKLAAVLGVGVGGTVLAELREGDRRTKPLIVSGLTEEPLGLQGHLRLAALERLLGEQGQLSAALLTVDPERVRAVDERLKRFPAVGSVLRRQALIDRVRQQMAENMGLTTAILTFFAVTIAVGVVYNNARVALSVRSRDLGSLRVLGFSRAEVSALLLGQLATELLLALGPGLLIGTALAHGMMSTVDPEQYRFPTVISARTYAFAVAVVIGAGVVSALLVRRMLDQLDLVAVLKTRE
ncbi:MAG: ABC transporter permease [Deltaproteobacteria bacterium]|nr:ABC transporter permease [Deltaproteobacteria bacterium]